MIELVRTRDRATLGCVDSFPYGTAWIDFVAPPDVIAVVGGGKFFPEHDQIDVYRDGAPSHPDGSPLEAAQKSQRPTEELVCLAHELGHLESKLQGNPFPPPSHEHIYAEEIRAWHLAERLLRENDFDDWSVFLALRTQGLASYRDNLALSDSQVATAVERARAGART